MLERGDDRWSWKNHKKLEESVEIKRSNPWQTTKTCHHDFSTINFYDIFKIHYTGSFKWSENCEYSHATTIEAGWLTVFPRGDHAWHSHLNGGFPKYSYTRSRETVAVTSWKCTPLWGSTWDSSTEGGGLLLPLHLKCTWKLEENRTSI